jgi:hypothetical protein
MGGSQQAQELADPENKHTATGVVAVSRGCCCFGCGTSFQLIWFLMFLFTFQTALKAILGASATLDIIPAATTKPTTIHHHQLQDVALEAGIINHRDDDDNTQLERVFEVTKPIEIPPGSKQRCSHLLLQHQFANTMSDPPTVTQYWPAAERCGDDWSKVVLRWHATSKGRQYDRISAVWLGGVEIFRTCTAEPTIHGITWEVEKDITRYSSLLKKPQTVMVELANVVDATYTGIYNVTLTVHFYTRGGSQWAAADSSTRQESLFTYGGLVADMIIPITVRSPSLQHGYWFQLQNESDIQSAKLVIPRNAYKAVLEICVSFHGKDEFWYTNPPEVWVAANNATTENVPGNGSFREVVVFIDGVLVAAVFPFPVLYTGGIDPNFYRPVSAIGSFNLPSYDADITPFLGKLVDGKKHMFSMTVTNALQMWLLGANLHLWLDKSREQTRGALLQYLAPALSSTLKCGDDFILGTSSLDGSFLTEAFRTITCKGYIESSFGNLTSTASYTFRFSNLLVYKDNANSIFIQQHTKTDSKVVVNSPLKDVGFEHSSYHFPLTQVVYQLPQSDGCVIINASTDHSWEQEQQQSWHSIPLAVGLGHDGRSSSASSPSSSFNSLKNKQKSKGKFTIPSPQGVVSGQATTQQDYVYQSSEGCYFRKLGVENYSFLYDLFDRQCISLA